MGNSITRSGMANVIVRLLRGQVCSECPLREACDIYEKESITGFTSICSMLNSMGEKE